MPILDPNDADDMAMVRELMGGVADGYDDDELVNPTLLTVTWGQMTARYPQLDADIASADVAATAKLAQAMLLASRVVLLDPSSAGTMRLGDMTISGASNASIASEWASEAWGLLAALYPKERVLLGGFGMAPGIRGGGRSGSVVEGSDRPFGDGSARRVAW